MLSIQNEIEEFKKDPDVISILNQLDKLQNERVAMWFQSRLNSLKLNVRSCLDTNSFSIKERDFYLDQWVAVQKDFYNYFEFPNEPESVESFEHLLEKLKALENIVNLLIS